MKRSTLTTSLSLMTALYMTAASFAAHAQAVTDTTVTVRNGMDFDLPEEGKITLAGVTKQVNIAYGSNPAHTLDVYVPPKLPKLGGAPILVMVHGGGWFTGDKGLAPVINNKGNFWLNKGFVFISVNYPLVPNSDPLTQANDVAKAIAFVQKNAAQWGGNANKMVVMGHSAGAHLVSLLGADPAKITKNNARPWLATISIDSGAVDVTATMSAPHPKFYDNAFGANKPLYWKASSPIDQLTSKATPFLLICAIPRDNSCALNQKFSDKAKSLGVASQVHEENLSHGETNDFLGLPGAYTDAVDRYISAILAVRR